MPVVKVFHPRISLSGLNMGDLDDDSDDDNDEDVRSSLTLILTYLGNCCHRENCFSVYSFLFTMNCLGSVVRGGYRWDIHISRR